MRVVHILETGLALCGAGMPNTWPQDDRWVSIADYLKEVDKNSICEGCKTAFAEADHTVTESTNMIPIEQQEDTEPPFEDCCFCFKPTRFWTELPDRKGGEQVACCQPCSKTHKPSEVPSKPDWCKEAEDRHPRLVPRWGRG